jgi:hypothetical protein
MFPGVMDFQKFFPSLHLTSIPRAVPRILLGSITSPLSGRAMVVAARLMRLVV